MSLAVEQQLTPDASLIEEHSDGESAIPSAQEGDEQHAAWVRYRTEYRDRLLGELLGRKDTKSLQNESSVAPRIVVDEPVFEIITTLRTRVREPGSSAKGDIDSFQPASNLLAKPEYHMNIYSPDIINALQSVVEYYPDQSLAGDPILVKWPYPVLVHHFDRLTAFRDAAKTKKPEELCQMEKNVVEHLTLLLDFLDETIMANVREEQERNKRGVYTWEYLWVGYRPGTTKISQMRGDEDWSAQVIHSIAGGVFREPPEPWMLQSWSLEYDGRFIGRKTNHSIVTKFDGESTWEIHLFDRDSFDPDKVDQLPEVVQKQIGYGRSYLELLQKQCRHCKGESRKFPHNEIDGLVMIDIKDYYDDTGSAPLLMDRSDCRPGIVDGSCAYCRRLRRMSGAKETGDSLVALFEDYNSITIDDPEARKDPHICLLCPVEASAFVFKTRAWEPVHVGHLSDARFEEDMINGLVMDDSRKTTLTSLAKSFARKDKHGSEVAKSMWTADFVRGKGSGLIFLLHGRPGVGKTCTAECIAAFTKRPLMVLTPSDIGDTPGDVEKNLSKMFKRAMSWGAVLLIDEADVFMERRSTSDLARNSLVAGFLRALENYDGILFLTTNRVGAFDDAFISRVHIQLYYPEFTDRERDLVWKTFMEKLARERGDYIRLNIDAKEYIRGSEMRSVEWNGREIRNALQTAVALAEYDAEKDEDGRIIVTDTHLKAIVELSRDFKKYLRELHKGDESKRAQRKYERLDDSHKGDNAQ